MKDPRVYLDDILESIELIQDYTSKVKGKHLGGDDLLKDAVYRRLGVIGEAVRQMPEEFKEKHSAIPWGEIVGLRNFLIHEYKNIEPERIMKIITGRLPELKKQIEKLVNLR